LWRGLPTGIPAHTLALTPSRRTPPTRSQGPCESPRIQSARPPWGWGKLVDGWLSSRPGGPVAAVPTPCDAHHAASLGRVTDERRVAGSAAAARVNQPNLRCARPRPLRGVHGGFHKRYFCEKGWLARGQGKPRLRTLGRAGRGPEEAGGPRQFEKARHAVTERGERCRVPSSCAHLKLILVFARTHQNIYLG
jgi:hypothetical protein